MSAIGGDVFGAIAQTVGGLINRQEARQTRLSNEKQGEVARHLREQDIAYQREFAQHGIRWRVEDAKAAGLHPLSALGAAGASYTPGPIPIVSSVPDTSLGDAIGRAGQDLGRAISASQNEQERRTRDLQIKLLETQVDRNSAEAEAIRSQEMRAWQQQWQSKPLNYDGIGLRASPFWGLDTSDVHRGGDQKNVDSVVSSLTGSAGRIKPKPDEVLSARPGMPQTTAGRHPSLTEYTVAPGFQMMLPQSNEGPGEALENVPLMLWPSLIAANSRAYGKGWTEKFFRFILGQDPNEPLNFFGAKDMRDALRRVDSHIESKRR